ncbi:hypothetical protein BCR41DRAFT_375582 [Lobosporangium transversale]|uniref:Uncharacterized protein n=1 Tax=Lobosporangium transversale TaxID=64571 RepID=A0A1Y2G6L3_9FUNG|nr:hypothetical protein BCR41DRAFT_375582 [Lobosporangium transversale]ORY98331.1 hypothetical protein BCR41DRAFT_375582 [Lobosporangium transversale]|eukprot:XP_021875742.1 hypothetical protein BCR41DRAFT_375582 [Lobosporangium transversale]
MHVGIVDAVAALAVGTVKDVFVFETELERLCLRPVANNAKRVVCAMPHGWPYVHIQSRPSIAPLDILDNSLWKLLVPNKEVTCLRWPAIVPVAAGGFQMATRAEEGLCMLALTTTPLQL